MFYDANIGERCETERTWFERGVNKKALLSSRTAEPVKSELFEQNIQSHYVVCCVCLHFIVAQVVGCAHFVVLYVFNHHILAVKLLDDDLVVPWFWMHALDSIVGNPNRIIAVMGINHKIPRSGLVPIHHHVNARRNGFGNLVDGFLDKSLLVFPSELVEPSDKDGKQQDDENHDE